MSHDVLIAGGGIGGLAAGVACARAGWRVRLYEQAPEFCEIGAGIQLGPNATRLLHEWGLEASLAQVAAFPSRLVVRSAIDGKVLATMPLGADFRKRYGAPYATVHRADLQALLLRAAGDAGVQVQAASRVLGATCDADSVTVHTSQGLQVQGDMVVAADGLWSLVREQVLGNQPPRATGDVAYRALARQQALPESWRSRDVVVWLGPGLHVVAYPVKQGAWLNVVAFTHGKPTDDAREWNQPARAGALQAAMRSAWAPLQDLVPLAPEWRMWTMHDRPPLRGPDEMAQGRVALLGDAAHPMLPYLAQGAGMAIEDAHDLGRMLGMVSGAGIDVPLALRRYALNRWQRCAQVQQRAQRNGRVFAARGLVQWARNASLRLLGERLLDQPWLYRGLS
jgi:salicylate hydroxylase